MLVLELLKAGVELLVPRVQDEDLEAQRRGGDDEVGQGDEAGDERHVCDGSLRVSYCMESKW